jgi:toxin CcdB
MPQFDVYTNMNQNTGKTFPYLVDVQSSLLESLETRLVIPLMLKSVFGGKPINNLTPCLTIKNQEYLAITPQMAAIHKNNLGKLVDNFRNERDAIVSSIDFLIIGF